MEDKIYNYKELKDIERFEFSPILVKRVKYADISRNDLDDISFLKHFTNLETLRMNSNNIFNIEAIGELKNLREVFMWNNFIQSIEPLRKCRKLELVNCEINNIDDISPINHVEFVYASHNRIKDLSKVYMKGRTVKVNYNNI